MKATGYIPVSACVYKIDEKLFSYNMDSEQWFCILGNYTPPKNRVIRKGDGKDTTVDIYWFQKDGCIDRPHREECMGKAKNKARELQIAVNTTFFCEHDQRQKEQEFLEKYEKRSAHEWKNGEMKRFHGTYF
jgi:hypothetical protein